MATVQPSETGRADHALETAWRTALALVPLVFIGAAAARSAPAYLVGGRTSRLFEGFAWLVAAALGAAAVRAARHVRPASVEWVPVAAFAAVVLSTAQIVAEHPAPSWDYRCYETAARAIADGRSPYSPPGNCYLYPPPLAAALAAVHRLAATATGANHPTDQAPAWALTRFVFQGARVIWIGCVYVVLYRLSRATGADTTSAAFIAATLLIVNAPLYHDAANDQVNLLVLALTLVGAATVGALPAVAGLALAAGVAIKLYPALLAAAWMLRHRRAAIWTAVWIVAIVALVGPAAWWFDFVGVWRTPLASGALRDNSVRGVLAAVAGIVSRTPDAPHAWVRWVWLVLAPAVLGSGVFRAWRRHHRRRAGETMPLVADVADAADALAIGLIVSPIAWEHHFVLAVPAAAIGALTAPPAARVRAWLGAALVFAVPVADFAILGANRLAGLIVLMTAPVLGGRAPSAGEHADG